MHTLCTRHIKCQLCREARSSKGGEKNVSLNAALIALCFIDEIIQDKNWFTHRELISFGIVRGMCEVPTQMMVSLVQEHPEGHLKILLDSAAPEINRSAIPARSHCCVCAMLPLGH